MLTFTQNLKKSEIWGGKSLRLILLLVLMLGSVGAWAQELDVTTVATFKSADLVTNSGYADTYGGTDWYISKGGNNKSIGFNDKNCTVIGDALGTSAKTTNYGVVVKSKKTLSSVNRITFFYDGGSGDGGKIYLASSTDNSSWQQLTLNTGEGLSAQGTTVSKNTTFTFEFDANDGVYYGIILDKGNATKAAYRFDNVVVTFYSVQTETKQVTSIAISGSATKASYIVGETPSAEGLVVTATYDDESTSDVTKDVKWSFNPTEIAATTTEVVATATYGEGENAKTAEYTIPVTVVQLSSISISGTPKTSYYAGDAFSTEGLTVTANYSNGDTEDVTASASWSFEPAILAESTASVIATATYNEKTASETYNVTVKPGFGNTQETAYTVEEVVTLIDELTAAGKETEMSNTDVYVKGIVTKVEKFNSTYGSITYWISSDGSTSAQQFECYGGLNIGGVKFGAIDDIEVGASVIVKGNMKKYDNVYEFDKNNELVSYVVKATLSASDVNYAADITSGEISYTIGNPDGSTVTASTETEWISDITVDGENNKVTFSMTENEETTAREGIITLTYGSLTKDVKVTQDPAVAKRTITIEDSENGTLKIYRDEVELVSGSPVPQGTVLTIEAIPNSGYKYRNWQYKVGDGSWATKYTDFTYTVGESDLAFRANFDAIVYNTITWSVNGTETTEQVEQGTAINFVVPTTGIPEEYKFMGWYDAALEATDVAPEFVTSATATADITYYAVFAKVGSGNEPELVKMTKSDDLTDGDNIVIVAVDGENSYGLYQETANTSYVNNFDFDGKVSSIEADSKKYLTVVIDGSNMYLGDDKNGYLYNKSSNELTVDLSNKSACTFSKDETNQKFQIKLGTRYLSFRNELTSSNKNLYRLGGTDATGNGIKLFDIYKYIAGSITYFDFRTSLSTAIITISENCKDSEGKYYGTYSSSKAFVVPDNITVSEIMVIDDQIMIDKYEKGAIVPANTGVMISADKAGDYKVELSSEEGTAKDGNMLRATGDAGISATDMATNDANCKFYRLTMHKGTTIGFFWGAAEGAAFNVAANKAYLAVPAEQASRIQGFVLGNGDGTTGIGSILTDEEESNGAEGVIYNLSGQRVARPVGGIYIVNGRKVFVK